VIGGPQSMLHRQFPDRYGCRPTRGIGLLPKYQRSGARPSCWSTLRLMQGVAWQVASGWRRPGRRRARQDRGRGTLRDFVRWAFRRGDSWPHASWPQPAISAASFRLGMAHPVPGQRRSWWCSGSSCGSSARHRSSDAALAAKPLTRMTLSRVMSTDWRWVLLAPARSEPPTR